MKKLKLIALFAAALVGLGIFQFLKELNKPQHVPHTTVVVAAVDIAENTQITPEMVTTRSIATDSLLADYILDTESVIGMVLSSDLYAGEQITRSRLVRMGEADLSSSTLAYVVKPGMRAITVFVDKDTGLMNFLKPGNRVDVMASFTAEDTRIVLNDDGEKKLEYYNVPITEVLAQNVEVLAVDTSMGKSGSQEYTAVTLHVEPELAVRINSVITLGKLRLILRSPLDTEDLAIDPVDPWKLYKESGRK